ncbi:DUF502 domain-containing protein [Szabonella alba]|uniref:DUF502 domain-containing protein n=1 Tax=Szabonella alba TaxID=2804194 RepID=A0A8K0V8D3_9RHOB|nr:DUF502 domain-containing protein [Szabonella alba]MBL4917243.1 DUF502 domain-containing protein [Szabonella alba]
MSDTPTPKRRGIIGFLRSSFLTGLVVVLPVALTLYLIWTVTGWIDGFVLPFIPAGYRPEALMRYFMGENYDYSVRGVGVVVFLIFTILVGWIARGLIGRSFIAWAERLVDRMPVVRSIYNGLKQIAETVFAQTDQNFEKACLVEYPKEGIWAIGFISTHAKGEIAAKFPEHDEILSVFLPTTPNPTSGFLLFVPSTSVRMLDMKIEDAAKLIISAGLVYPNDRGAIAVQQAQLPPGMQP